MHPTQGSIAPRQKLVLAFTSRAVEDDDDDAVLVQSMASEDATGNETAAMAIPLTELASPPSGITRTSDENQPYPCTLWVELMPLQACIGEFEV